MKRPADVSIEDAQQDAVVAYLQVWQDYDPLKTPTVEFDRWLFQRVKGILQDKYGTEHRRAKAVPRVGQGVNPESYAAPVIDQDTALDLQEAIKQLKPNQRRVVRMIMSGKTQEQIAKEHDIGQPAVSQLYDRAKENLRRILGAAYEA